MFQKCRQYFHISSITLSFLIRFSTFFGISKMVQISLSYLDVGDFCEEEHEENEEEENAAP